MAAGESDVEWTTLVDEPEDSPEHSAWLLEHPVEAAEIAMARRVHVLLAELRAIPVTVPPDFEARLLDRCRQDTTIIHLLELWLARGSRALLELLAAIFNSLPGLLPVPDAAGATRS